jgi:hypothetical protein
MNTVERRKIQRVNTLKAGLILLQNGGGGTNCVVRNISPFGACLKIVNHASIPLDIILVIAGEHFKRPCRIIWRSNNELGVCFG